MDIPADRARDRPADRLLARVAALLPAIESCAALRDEQASFPAEELAMLRGAGALSAPAPVRCGGLGLGTQPEGAGALLGLLRLIGRASLPLGRVFEGHVNALKLVAVHGSEAQIRDTARDAAAGHLFGLWVTDDDADPVRLRDGRLHGAKSICSAAGHATLALITADAGDPTPRMLVVRLGAGEVVRPRSQPLQGMRAATSGRVEFHGVPAEAAEMIGRPGDYLRQPHFSAGAWRTSAVTLGGLDALVGQARAQLTARGRDGDPHQRARLGEAIIAAETAALWLGRAAPLAEDEGRDPDDVVAYVNLARIAVERACLAAMALVQRSLGLAAYAPPNPVERLCRDLGTYLRQPAPDETLTEAAAHFLRRELPA